MKKRTATVTRKSTETNIQATLIIDGKGEAKLKTPIGILNHMLELFTFHGIFDLAVTVKKADTSVDIHHINEDIGIVLGKAFREALDTMKGIRRFGFAAAPMESTVCYCAIDISGRGHLSLAVENGTVCPPSNQQDGYAINYLEHFLESFAKTLGATINVRILKPSMDLHTNLETAFKALGLALKQAADIDPRRAGIPSTKGIIDS